MFPLLDGVTHRARTERRDFAEQHDVDAIDDFFISVEAPKDSVFQVDAAFELRLEPFGGGFGVRFERVGQRDDLRVRVGVQRVDDRPATAPAAPDEADFQLVALRRVNGAPRQAGENRSGDRSRIQNHVASKFRGHRRRSALFKGETVSFAIFNKTAKIVKVAVSPQKPGLADYRYTSDRPPFQVSARNFFRFFPDFRDFQEKIRRLSQSVLATKTYFHRSFSSASFQLGAFRRRQSPSFGATKSRVCGTFPNFPSNPRDRQNRRNHSRKKEKI